MSPLQDTTGPYAAIPNVSVLLTPLTTQEAVFLPESRGLRQQWERSLNRLMTCKPPGSACPDGACCRDFPTEILPASLRLLINFLKNAFCYPRRGSQRQGIKGSRPVGGQSPANILSSLLRLMARYSLSFEKISRVIVSSYPICFSAFTTSANSMVPAPMGR